MGPPRLQIFNTEQGGAIQTLFFLPTAFSDAPRLHLSVEPCGHIPSPDDSKAAPFYPDHSQRVLAVCPGWGGACYVINTELLLKLARERKGQGVGWDEWGSHTTEAHVGDLGTLSEVWTSGCRLFCIVSGVDMACYLRMYDFSHAGRTKYLRTPDVSSEGGGGRLISPRLYGHELSWNLTYFCDTFLIRGHESIILWVVSILVFLSTSSQMMFCVYYSGSGPCLMD